MQSHLARLLKKRAKVKALFDDEIFLNDIYIKFLIIIIKILAMSSEPSKKIKVN